jgi:hypothetical protein
LVYCHGTMPGPDRFLGLRYLKLDAALHGWRLATKQGRERRDSTVRGGSV